MQEENQFGIRLRDARKKKRYTLDKVAEKYNEMFDGSINKGTLSKYENSKQIPMIKVAGNLSVVLDVSVDYLLGKSDDTNTENDIYLEDDDEILVGMWQNLSPIRRQMVDDLIQISWERENEEAT